MSEDKTRMDPREVLTALEIEERAMGREVFANLVKAHKDKHYPPPAPAIVIPDAAIAAAGDGMYLMGWSDRREMLKAAAPYILAANQKKPKVESWAVVDKSGVMRSRTLWNDDADGARQSHDRIFPDRAPHRVLALVEPSEVQP